MEELQQQQPLMSSRCSNSRKVTEPRVAEVRHAANAAHLTHPENVQHGAQNVTSVETKIILVCFVGPGTDKIPKTETNTDWPIEPWSKRRSRSRHRRYASEDLEDRPRSTARSAHSIQWNSFQDHPELHGRHPLQSNDFVKKTFHTISRSRSVASISNEMDPEGKTKILTVLNIKLPHRNGIDNMRVQVDNGAEANILPLDSFRTMFPHALDKQGYPKDGFLRRSRTNLECYDDGKLINHCSIKLRLLHYSDKSFQDHYFYIVETKTHEEIIVGHAASSRLGLIQVLCKNGSKSIVKNKTNTNSRDSFQDPCLKIDGKTQLRNQRVTS